MKKKIGKQDDDNLLGIFDATGDGFDAGTGNGFDNLGGGFGQAGNNNFGGNNNGVLGGGFAGMGFAGGGGVTGGGSIEVRSKNHVGALKIILGIVIVAIVVVGVYLGISLLLGPSKGQCNDLVEKLDTSIKTLNLEMFADCLEKHDKNELSGIADYSELTDAAVIHHIISALAGCGGNFLKDLADLAPEQLKGVLQFISIEPVSYGFPGLSRKVKCTLKAAGFSTIKFVLTIKKQDGRPYIAGIELE